MADRSKTDPLTSIPAPPQREPSGERLRAAGVAETTALLTGAGRLTPGDALHVKHKWEADLRPPIMDHRGWRPFRRAIPGVLVRM
jgi:hypothetical protein